MREGRATAQPAPVQARAADAQTTPADIIPDMGAAVVPDLEETWRELPVLAGRAQEVIRSMDGVQGVAVRAWGDAATGCFFLIVRLQGGGVSLHESLRDGLASGGAQLGDWTMEDLILRTSSRFSFAAGELRGHVRAVSHGLPWLWPETQAVMCFYNPREPAVAERACAQLFDAVGPEA